VARPILVTGAHGFVGQHLLAELGPRAVPLDADVTDGSALAAALEPMLDFVAIAHLAALSSVGDSWDDLVETWRVNVLGTVNVLEAAAQGRVLVVSTGEVYGQADQTPTPESAPVRPRSPYAASKAAAELAASQAGPNVVVVRPFQHEGPGRDERFAVGSWAAQIARAEEVGGGTVEVGDLSPRRDVTDVRDVCRAYKLLLDPAVPGGTYNVASGRSVEMREILEILVGLATCPIEIRQESSRMRPADVPVLCGDASKLRAATGWEPTIPLEQTLRDVLRAARETTTERMANA
jgi:GDP-4-dehydro-6-deoxy-D-mannose reductase